MSELYSNYPTNDFRDYLAHKWKKHKYIAIINGRYIYPGDKTDEASDANSNKKFGRSRKKNVQTGNTGTVKKGEKLRLGKKLGIGSLLGRPLK